MIHQQLLTDCHLLGHLVTGALLLHRNPALPWFILVPATEIQDILDLPPPQRDAIVADCARVSAFLKRELKCAKVNFAGLGNQVPQMHLHVIGRRVGDACWPQPVWGNLPEAAAAYEDAQLADWQHRLRESCGLRVAEG